MLKTRKSIKEYSKVLKNVLYITITTAPLFSLAACSANKVGAIKAIPPSSIKVLAGSKPPTGIMVVNRTALLKGKLVVIDNCLYLQNTSPELKQQTNTLTTWKWSVELRQHGNKRKLVNTANNRTATIGEFNKFGGGFSRVNKGVFRGCKVFGKTVASIDTIILKK
jgi:hypothetical protein